jgi:PAS domain S-box-containing protein
MQTTKKDTAVARRSEYLAALVALLIVYFLAGKLGLRLAFVHANATPVWPPTGIALAGFLVLGYRVWPAIFLGAFLVNITTPGLVATADHIATGNTLHGLLDAFLANVTTFSSVATSIGIATGNTLEGLLGACLMNRFANGRNAFDHPRTVSKFAVLAGAVSTMASATIGVTSLVLGGSASSANYGAIWVTWWLGDAAGALLVAPLLVLWNAKPDLRCGRAQALEVALCLTVLFLIGLVVFTGFVPSSAKNYPFSFLCIPPVIWAAFRFGQRETVTMNCLLSGIAIWGTLHGYGPFVGGTQNQSLIFLQAFMGVIVVMAMAVNAIVREHRQAEDGLRKAHEELERRVYERTTELAQANRALKASREQLIEAQQVAQVGSWEWDIDKNIIRWSDELYRIYGWKPREISLTYERFLECVHPDDRSAVREAVESARQDHRPFDLDHRIIRPDGTERILRGRGLVIVDQDERVIRMIGTGQDVTERKLAEAVLSNAHDELERRVQERTAELAAANDAFMAEIVEHKRTAEALRDSRTRFQAIFENSIDAIGVSKNGVHVLINPAYLKMFGYSQVEEMTGKSVLEFIAPSQRELIRERIQRRAIGADAPTHYETRGLHKDGSEFDLEVDVSSYKLKGEIYTLVILRDVTERKRAGQLLMESEALKGAILESSIDCVIAMNHEGKVIEWNPAAEKTFGYSRADVLGREMSELIIPSALREKHRQGLARFLATGEGPVLGKRIEMTAMRADGREFPAELAITRIQRDGPPAFTGYVRDITDRKLAEKALRESEARKSAILETALDAILSIDPEGRVHEWNPAAEKIFGYGKAEAIGRKMDELIIPTSLREYYRDSLAEYLMTGVGSLLGRPIEVTLTRADRTEFRAELSITRNSWDERTLYTCFIRDITERKRAEEARNQLAAIVESSDDAIISKTLDGTIVSWNAGAERIFGYSAEEATGRLITLLIPPELHDEELQIREKLKRGGPVEHYETLRLPKDGSRIHVSLTISPIKDSNGRIIGASKIARDITERKRAEEEIRKLNAELEQRVIERTAQLEAINQELESFTYSVSHDLRAPLRAMQGLANALLEDYVKSLDETGRDYARRIVFAAGRMETLIQDLLAYSRLSRVDLELRPVDLGLVFAEVQHQLGLDIPGRNAHFSMEGELPSVVGHRATLVQVVSNLVSNGIKFVAPGVTPHVKLRGEDRGERVRLWVEDNGIGIAPEYQQRVFRIFERLHGIETYPGTGIGLAIVQKGAERLGARVGVESALDCGSKFWVELRKA